MGRNWFCIVNRAFSDEPEEQKEQKDQKPQKPKRRWFGRKSSKDAVTFPEETPSNLPSPPPPQPATAPQPPLPPLSPPPPHLPSTSTLRRPSTENVKKYSNEAEDEQTRQALALATAVAAEAAVVAAQAAAEVVRLTTAARTVGKSREETAAIKIQTAFRTYLARRALRALRGLSRLKALVQGRYVKRQATATLRSMQTLARVQSQIRERRNRISEENKARHRLLQQKQPEKEPEKTRTSIGEDWDLRTKSKEQIKASLLYKKEAAVRRERALAYAYSHQQTWRNSSKLPHQALMDPNNPHWGWSWLERWMAARPWETHSKMDNTDRVSVKSFASCEPIQSIKTSPSARKTSVRQKTRKAVSQGTIQFTGNTDSRSVQSERVHRRHSICVGSTSSVKDKESESSSSSVKSYLGPKKMAKARVSLSTPSHLGSKKTDGGVGEKRPEGSAKKRLSFSGSPRRLSDPVKEKSINGGSR